MFGFYIAKTLQPRGWGRFSSPTTRRWKKDNQGNWYRYTALGDLPLNSAPYTSKKEGAEEL